jgi:hypothetical protein
MIPITGLFNGDKDPSPDIDNLYYPEQHTCTVELNRYHLKSIH